MGTLVVLDASVVIGVLEIEDAHHAAASSAVSEHLEDDVRLPASAYAEVLAGPARQGLLDAAREKLARLSLQIDPIGTEAAEEAARLRGVYPTLRLPDALVLGHAQAIGADVLLTTDRRWACVSPLVRVVA